VTSQSESLRKAVQQSAVRLSASRGEIRKKLQQMYGLTKEPSGVKACLLYLTLFLGQPIPTRELEVVSGINEYARRIRELRVEHGYDIAAQQGQGGWSYTLRARDPNPAIAAQWQTLNKIRKLPGSGQDRILAALKEFLGKPLSIEQLIHVSKIKTARERARDLRLQFGWRIFGHHTGRPDLAVTEYVLESLDQLPAHDRKISDLVYESVLNRDGYECQKSGCGWSRSQRVQGSRKQFLEVHHRLMHSRGGTNDAQNLVTLCNMDHDEVHRLDIEGTVLDAWLQSP
jgi:hypothetical protein